MLSVTEFHESLYRAIDKQNSRKEMIQDYGSYLKHSNSIKSNDVEGSDDNEHLEHHGVKGQKHGVRRWQNEDGSLTPEGRVHYGYGPEGQSKAGKKLEKYTNKEHDRYDKFHNKRAASFDKDIERREKKFLNDKSDKNKEKLIKAYQNKIEDDMIAKHMHNKIDDLTVDTYKADRKVGRMATLRSLPLVPGGAIGGAIIGGLDAVRAVKKGALGNHGSAADLEKYISRISDDEYKAISGQARKEAEKQFKQKIDGNNKGEAYFDKYSYGTKEYKQAQAKADAAEKPVFAAEHKMFEAESKYGSDSPQARAAKDNYLRKYHSFEKKYGYSPQEYD